ncbi:TPA: AIPR family protein [Clostridium perfringens]
MNRIIESLFENFVTKEELIGGLDSKNFEKFIVKNICQSVCNFEFKYDDIITGSGGDCGIDGLAFIINDIFISNYDELEKYIEMNNSISVKILFIQCKSSERFECKEIRGFGDGIVDFLSEEPKKEQSDIIRQKHRMFELIIKNYNKIKNEFECFCYYVTTGTLVEDKNIKSTKETILKDIQRLEIFKNVTMDLIGEKILRRIIDNNLRENSAIIKLDNKIEIPYIEGINQGYIGIIKLEEYLNLLIDGNGNIKREIFWGNVRDYQGDDNSVNKEINDTIDSEEKNRFGILNNGITIIVNKIEPCRGNIELKDYQIVNGCQTSYVLYKRRKELNSEMWVTIKIIETADEDIINSIIKSSNNQTNVTEEQMMSLDPYQKELEQYYCTYEDERKLYYERRSGQYNNESIPTYKIISIEEQLKAFTSMFLDEPNKSSRFYGEALKNVGKKVFLENHKHIYYYTSAYALFKLEYYFTNNLIDKKYKKFEYFLLCILKYLIVKEKTPRFNQNNSEAYCNKILSVLYDENKCRQAIINAIRIIDICVTNLSDTEVTKRSSLMEKCKRAINDRVLEDVSKGRVVLVNLSYFKYVFGQVSHEGDMRFKLDERIDDFIKELEKSNLGRLYKNEIIELKSNINFKNKDSRKDAARRILDIINKVQ